MKDNSKIKAVILAAGEGTRLRPYTLDRPKCLVEIDGEPLLARQLEVLAAEGVRNVVMIGGY
ncbi:sugar phosphate nucleotidyltransferase, partial [Thiobacillus sp.]|uniref:sugar phosphate nucleotidyltransferase n=1 Tax=Thiobacillus sp. TaxID=924 RepID=UPI00286DA50C